MIDRVVVLNDVSTARGGATGLALASIRALRARGVAVTVITGDDGDNPEFARLGVESVPINQALLLDAGFRKAAIRGLYNPATYRVIRAWIAANDTPRTVYHVHTWSKILSPSLFQALRPVARRSLVSAHDFFLVCPNGGYVFYGSGAVCHLRPMSLPCIASQCDKRSYAQKLWRVARQGVRQALIDFERDPVRVLAIHDGMLPGLERGGIPASAITVIRNPIRPFRESRIVAEANRAFVFIGRLDTEKGADLAAKGARAAGVRLRIIGDGPMMAELRRDYPEVEFCGQQPADAIGALVEQARGLIMSSRYPEPFGLVAGEAMWSGLPVILPSTALMASEIEGLGAGIAYDPRSPLALGDCLRHVAGDDALVAGMSRAAFTATRSLGNTPDDWIDALLRSYRDSLLSDQTHLPDAGPAAAGSSSRSISESVIE